MASDDSSGARPAGPVVLRIKLRYDDVDAMVQKFAPNVGKSGLFLPTKSIQPIGTEIKFELRIANDTAVLVGLGKVKAVRNPDPANPRAAFGMAIELMRVTREGREVIMRMLERRKAMGLPDIAIPLPDDVDTARRMDVETQPKVDVAATVRDATPTRASGPIAPEPLLTAPRPGSGPIARAKGEPIRPSAPALAPEPTKAKRPRMADLIAKANESSGALAAVAVPGLDEHVDVERALTRARALAGGDVDTELAALRESVSAPHPIDIEAASAELAKQLGGAAIVKRDRSTRWAPPPAIETTATDAAADAAAAAVAAAAASMAAEAAEEAAAAVPSAEPVAAPEPEPTPAADADAGSESEFEAVAESVDVLRQRFTAAFAPAPAAEAPAVADTIDEESRHEFRRPQTSSAEMDRLAAEQAIAIASQEAGAITAVEPEPEAPAAPEEIRTDPSQLAAQPAMLIDDDADLASFENALDAARVHTGVAQAAPPPEVPDEDDAEQLDSLDLELADESTEIGEMPVAPDPFPQQYATLAATHDELAARLDQQLDAAEEEANSDFAIALHAAPQPAYETVDASEDFADEEISDLDVLAEADADDADLLNADGERDASDSHEAPIAPAVEPTAPPPEYDFAAQLDLGDDDAPPAGDRSGAFYDRNLGELPSTASKGHQLGEYDPGYDPPSSSYTFAENYPQAASTFDDPQAYAGSEDSFDEPHQFSQDDPRQFGAQPQSFDPPAPPFGGAAGRTRGPAVDGPHRLTPTETFDEPHGFAAGDDPRASSPIAPPPYRSAHLPSSPAKLTPSRQRSRPDEDYDLEDALSTLDVDLDHLEIPPDPPSQSQARPLPGMPPAHAPVDVETVRPGSNSGRVSLPKDSPRSTSAALNAAKTTKPPRAKRAVTEDEGVLIDFDDDE